MKQTAENPKQFQNLLAKIELLNFLSRKIVQKLDIIPQSGLSAC